MFHEPCYATWPNCMTSKLQMFYKRCLVVWSGPEFKGYFVMRVGLFLGSSDQFIAISSHLDYNEVRINLFNYLLFVSYNAICVNLKVILLRLVLSQSKNYILVMNYCSIKKLMFYIESNAPSDI